MTNSISTRTGGQILVDQLIRQGVDHVFCVPGESYLAVLDALHDASIQVTVCRQEGGAAMMADAYGRLTGRPGICMVTRAPGATNASAGIHIAEHDSSPMIMFVGQVDRSMMGRGAFQEVDYRQFFGGMAKWVAEIDNPARIPEMIARAYATAMQGRPGPVVLALPEDMLTELAAVLDAPKVEAVETYPSTADMARLDSLLSAAQKPVVILGGSRWDEASVAALIKAVEVYDLPVTCQFRRQMLFPHDHPNYIGDLGLGCNPALIDQIKTSDLVVLIGGRLAEIPSQSYTLFGIPNVGQTFVHVHADSAELGRVYAADLAIHASPRGFATAFAGLAAQASRRERAVTRQGHDNYLAWRSNPVVNPGPIQMAEVMRHLRAVLADDAILCNGAGNYATWLHRFFPFRRFATQLAPASGSMGYGPPSAVAAARMFPGRSVVALAGDGCFMMNGQEFATAVQYDLPIICLVIDNGMYGTIRMHQEREYPGRISATALKNPDFAALARAFGGHGETVRTTEEFAPAFERAQQSGKPSILHLIIDPEAITPTTTLTAIRQKAIAARS